MSPLDWLGAIVLQVRRSASPLSAWFQEWVLGVGPLQGSEAEAQHEAG